MRSLFREATTVRAEAILAAGPEADTGIESDLRRLVAGPVPDEPAAALLVRLLAAAGRETEALEVVEALRRELKQRYGTDPSPVLAQVHVALLRGELSAPASIGPARAAPPRPRGTPLPAGWRRATTPLLRRDEDLAAVAAELAGAALVTIVGPGGVGKTRLAAEVARRAAGGAALTYVD